MLCGCGAETIGIIGAISNDTRASSHRAVLHERQKRCAYMARENALPNRCRLGSDVVRHLRRRFRICEASEWLNNAIRKRRRCSEALYLRNR